MRLQPREQLTHSLNPYIHKCCGCIHLRTGATLSCLMWAVSKKKKHFFYQVCTILIILYTGTIFIFCYYIVSSQKSQVLHLLKYIYIYISQILTLTTTKNSILLLHGFYRVVPVRHN